MLFTGAVHNLFAERLQPRHAALILVDCQVKFIADTSDAPEALYNNILGLANVARGYDLPVVMGSYKSSRHNAVPKELAELFSSDSRINRQNDDLSEDLKTRQKIQACGRQDLIIAGVARNSAFVDLALVARRDGFNVHIVVDAASGGDALSQRIAVAAISAAGIKLTNWVAIMAELTASGGALVNGHRAAVDCYLNRYSANDIRWGGDEIHLSSAPSSTVSAVPQAN